LGIKQIRFSFSLLTMKWRVALFTLLLCVVLDYGYGPAKLEDHFGEEAPVYGD